MSTTDDVSGIALVVAEDGGTPAAQLEHLGLVPDTPLRVTWTAPAESEPTLAGSLHDFPELEWADVVNSSELARQDLASARGSSSTLTPWSGA